MKNNIESLKSIIEYVYEHRFFISSKNNRITIDGNVVDINFVIKNVIKLLNKGQIRVAEKINDNWIVHQWLKKTILLAFRVMDNRIIQYGDEVFFDKISLKFTDWKEEQFKKASIRVVPPATVRYGAYIAPNVVIMPSYVNIGAYIDVGTMVDTWATVGSCAQIGKNVHLSGGVGIGGVLEPLQNSPTIIEDDCFIGARSEIVEGVIVEKGSVISMGVFIGQSTKIYDRENGNIYYGRIPSGSVVIPGTLPYRNINSDFNISCAIIIKKVDENTRRKTSINELLRDT